MNMKLGIVLALAFAGVFPAASIYAWQSREANPMPEGSEFGRDAAIDYILLYHGELRGLGTPSIWQERNLTPEGLVGSNVVEFTSDGWTVKVSNAVVLEPVYTVEIEFVGDVDFQWRGTVDQDGNVVELEFTVD